VNPKLFKNHRLMFIEDASEAGAGAPDEGQEPKGTDDSETDAPKDGKNDDGKPSESDLPEWAQRELSRARSEAGKYRTERNELREKLKDAKTPEDIEAATKEYVEKVEALELQLTRERIARQFNLPDELAERLRGANEEELKADAQALQKFARPVSARGTDDPKGGLDPSTEPERFDASKAAEKILSQF
jgi:hypothetical protein